VLQAEPGTGPIVYMAGVDSTTLLDGFTLQGAASGAMVIFEASPIVRNCRFINNAADSGGAMLIDRCRSVVVKNCVFERNTATLGGAIAFSGSDPQQADLGHSIEACVFVENNASVSGGAIYSALDAGSVTLSSSVFIRNIAQRTGGAIHSLRRPLHLINATCYGNRATSPLPKALTFQCEGGGSLLNSIVWNGHNDLTPNVRVVPSGPSFEHTRNLIEKDYFYGTVFGDPMFADTVNMVGADGRWGTADDGLRIGVTSAANNMGAQHKLLWSVATDVTGQRRRMYGRLGARRVDLGAYDNWWDTVRDTTGDTGWDAEWLRDKVLLICHAEARTVRTAADVNCTEVPGLTPLGLERAGEVGRVMRLRGVQPSEVLTGDACGMRETSAALWDIYTPHPQWLAGADTAVRAERFTDLSRPTVGGPRYIVTSQDVIAQMWRGEKEQLLPLDILVVEPRGEQGYAIVAHYAYETVVFSR
jgi:predicted outer membrane repeat protein